MRRNYHTPRVQIVNRIVRTDAQSLATPHSRSIIEDARKQINARPIELRVNGVRVIRRRG